MPPNMGAKDLSERICANVNHAALALTDPSRKLSQVLMQLAKPIPIALFFDSRQPLWKTALKEV
jgi:hypothetical protein